LSRIDRLAGDPPSPWEERYGFSRTVRAGELVMVGGTTAAGPGGSIIGETPYQQTAEVLRRIVHELERAGASASDVVQTRIYVTDIAYCDDIARAFGEVFGEVRPLMTMVEVSALIDPRMWVEIEAVAHLPGR
jgi:enamine deaminase RidA (YjgF/YER057c/UK114 family)